MDLTQNQKDRRTPIVVDATPSATVGCGTTARPWIVLVSPSAGEAFENGDGALSAATVDIANGVTPTTASAAVRLVWQKN